MMPRSFLRRHRELLSIVASLVVSVMAAIDMIGHPARLVSVIALFAAALTLGISLGVAIQRRRSLRRPLSAPAPDGGNLSDPRQV